MSAARRKSALDPTAGTRRPSLVDAPLPEKPRGSLSFLTWPFIVAQFLVVEQALAEGARATAADESAAAGQDGHPPPDTGDGSDAAALGIVKTGIDDAPAPSDSPAGGQSGLAHAPAAASVQPADQQHTDPLGHAAQHPVEAVSGAGGSVGDDGPVHRVPLVADASESGLDASAHTVRALDAAGVLPGIEPTAESIASIAGNGFEHVEPIPVPGLDLPGVLNDIAGLAVPVAASAWPAVDALAVSVVGAADHIVADLAPAVESVLQMAATATDAVTGIVDHGATDLGAITDAVPGALSTIVDAVASVVDGNGAGAASFGGGLPSALAAAADPVASLVDPGVHDAVLAGASALHDSITSVEHLADPALGDHVATEVAPAVDAIPATLAAVTGLVGDLPPSIDAAPGVHDLATAHEAAPDGPAPTADQAALGPVTTLAAGLVDGLLGGGPSATVPPAEHDSHLLANDSAFASGGTIAIADQPPSPTAANDLFAAGQYTDYGMTLSSDAAHAATGPATLTFDQAAASETAAVDIVHHGATNGAAVTDDLQHQPLVHGLDDLAVRVGDSLL